MGTIPLISSRAVIAGGLVVATATFNMVLCDPGRGRTKTGYFWAIARDDRPWGGSDPPVVVYSYAPGRGGASTRRRC